MDNPGTVLPTWYSKLNGATLLQLHFRTIIKRPAITAATVQQWCVNLDSDLNPSSRFYKLHLDLISDLKSWICIQIRGKRGELSHIGLKVCHCLPELALGRPRITDHPCVCVSVCLGVLRAHYTPLQRYMGYSGYIMHHCLSTLCSRSILLSTLCACWALADRPTASLFIYKCKCAKV